MYGEKRSQKAEHKGMMKPITTTIPLDIYNEAGKRRIPLQHIFMRGWLAFNSEPQIINRTRELETSIEKLNRIIASYRQRIVDLENLQSK